MDIPNSMQAELKRWNDGQGIDLAGWVSCEGNFSLAVGYASIFNPQLIELDDHIFRQVDVSAIYPTFSDYVASWSSQPDAHPYRTESVINHFHLSGIQALGCEDISSDKLIVLGSSLKSIYEAKLSYLFPDKPCEVDFYIPENEHAFDEYQLSFWQRKHRIDHDNN